MPTQNLIAKMRGYFPVSEELKHEVKELARERIKLAAGESLIRAGDKYTSLYLIDDGWMLRARYLPGGTRQIFNFALPGDFLNYNSLMFQRSKFDLVARTEVSLWKLEAQSFRTMIARHPGLAERVVSLGRRDARERLAHVFCEIVARLELIQRHDGKVLQLPLLQEDFADILGLSVIHIVRVFSRLELMGVVRYKSRRVQLTDLEKLKAVAGFDGEDLHFPGGMTCCRCRGRSRDAGRPGPRSCLRAAG